MQPDGPSDATALCERAAQLVGDVRAGRAARERLAEARADAERALAIAETLDGQAPLWTALGTLAAIADLEGLPEQARAYRGRERAAYAAFDGNRRDIDRRHGPFILALAAAAQGEAAALAVVQDALPQAEAAGWRVTAAAQRILSGERRWEALVEDLDCQDALLVGRVLDVLAQPREAEVVRSAGAGPGNASDVSATLAEFEPLLQAIAAGDAAQRAAIAPVLADLERKGWHLQGPVRRLWAGERDAEALVAGLDAQDSAMVRRLLEILAGR